MVHPRINSLYFNSYIFIFTVTFYSCSLIVFSICCGHVKFKKHIFLGFKCGFIKKKSMKYLMVQIFVDKASVMMAVADN